MRPSSSDPASPGHDLREPQAAPSWQQLWQERFYRSRPRWIDGTTEFWDLCRQTIPQASQILEIGAGPTNRTTHFLATLGELHGVDIDPAVQRNTDLRSATVLHGSRLPFSEGAFDACVSNFVMEHVSSPADHLAEIRRVLRPGGVYVFRTPNRWHYVALLARITPLWFHRRVANRVRGLASDAHPPYPTHYLLNTRAGIAREALAAGLRVRFFRMIEKDPSYGMSSRLLYLLFLAYERMVNSSRGLEGIRANILGVLDKP